MFANDVARRYVYNSNRLDGISLSEEQTQQILDGQLPRGEDVIAPNTPARAHAEVVYRLQRRAVTECARQGKGQIVTRSKLQIRCRQKSP